MNAQLKALDAIEDAYALHIQCLFETMQLKKLEGDGDGIEEAKIGLDSILQTYLDMKKVILDELPDKEQ